MQTILALDIGDKRIGVALGHLSPATASPFATFEKAAGKAEDEILKLIKEKSINLVVAGLPLGANGARTSQCEKVEKFCARLAKRADITIQFVDEYLSSEDALELLRTSGKSRSIHKELIDSYAAAVILRRYLDNLGT